MTISRWGTGVFVLTLALQAAASGVFRCVDAQGRVTFADQPCEGGTRVRPGVPPGAVVRERIELTPEQRKRLLADVQVALVALEVQGQAMRGHFSGPALEEWCDRRLLARIHRYTLKALRRSTEPVSPAAYMRFLLRWHEVDGERQHQPARGVGVVADQVDPPRGHRRHRRHRGAVHEPDPSVAWGARGEGGVHATARRAAAASSGTTGFRYDPLPSSAPAT